MADRKKVKKAAIDFSVETSTPAEPVAPKPEVKPVVTASEILPGLRKKQAEDAVPPHRRAAADKAKRQEEIAKGIDEARMPGQNEAEERWKSDRRPAYTQEERDAFAEKQKSEYEDAPVTEAEQASADRIAKKAAKARKKRK